MTWLLLPAGMLAWFSMGFAVVAINRKTNTLPDFDESVEPLALMFAPVFVLAILGCFYVQFLRWVIWRTLGERKPRE